MLSAARDPSRSARKRRKTLPVVLDARVVKGSGGGPDKTILNSPRFLLSAGYRNLCAYLHPPADPGLEQLRSKALLYKAPLLSVPDRGPWDLQVIPELLRICRKERVAIWHGHEYKTNALGLLLKRFWPMRLVTTVHGWVQETKRTPLYYGIDRLCLPFYERVICVSEDLYQRSLALGVPEARCVLIENGIDTEEYSRTLETTAAKRKLGIPAERFVIGAVGRLSSEKGFDVLIRSVDRLLKAGGDVQLLIVGEGDEQPRLQALIAQLAHQAVRPTLQTSEVLETSEVCGHQDRIRLLGYRQDTKDLYQGMDVFALSSYREGLPNVLLEAMAMEVPVVATRVAGVPKLIRDGENGLLVEPGNVDQLADALSRMIGDSELRDRLRIAGRKTIVEGHSFATRMQKVRAIYDELLSIV